MDYDDYSSLNLDYKVIHPNQACICIPTADHIRRSHILDNVHIEYSLNLFQYIKNRSY